MTEDEKATTHDLEEFIERLPDLAFHSIGQGLRLRRKRMKKLRTELTGLGLDPEEVDEELDLLLGTGDDPGLMKLFEVDDETIEREKKEEESDPAQRDIDDPRDYRTHGKTTEEVRELVSSIGSDEKPAAAVRMLNALEDGEGEREGGARKSVLDVIRSARSPLAKRIEPINGGDDEGPEIRAVN